MSPSALTTHSAGCSSVGPPRGISATARWRPGASRGGTGASPTGRAVAAGALTAPNALTRVPSSVGRTGRYWPDGHHAHASSATRAAAPAITKACRGRCPSLQPHAFLPIDLTMRTMISVTPSTGSASASSRAIEVSTPKAPWSGIAETRFEPLSHAEAASFGNSRIALKAMPSRIGTMISTHTVTRMRAQPFSAEGSRLFHGSRRLSVGPMCA